MPYGIIYLIQNIQNHKVYVGQTIYPDPIAYIHKHFVKAIKNHDLQFGGDGRYFYRAIRKYGKLNFQWKILGECSTQNELDEAEKTCIEFFQSRNPIYGYNMTDGGGGTVGFSYLQIWEKRYGKENAQKLNQQLSASKGLKKEKNPMHGISMLQRLVNKYGEKEGNKKYLEWRQKQKECRKGIKNPAYKHGKCIKNENNKS